MRFFACYLFLVTFFGATFSSAQDSKPLVQKTPNMATSGSPKRPIDDLELITGKVIRVLDGDTIRIKIQDRTIHSVRLQGIDAPEGAQQDAEKARKKLSDLVLGENVRVAAHKRDQNGMIIGTVYLRGQDVGLAQIESGMAWHFKQFAYEQTAASRKTYSQTEANARTARLGLWGKDNPTAPWDFRNGRTTQPEVRDVKAAGLMTTTTTTAPRAQPAPSGNPTAERKYILGPRGGCYYVSSSGGKVYVSDKSLCAAQQTGIKP